MACSGKCVKCGTRYDKFNGFLVNISDGLLSILSRCYDVELIKQQNTIDGKVKHFVLCSDCIERFIGGRYLNRFTDFKFKNGKWMTSNVAYILRRQNLLNEASLQRLKELDDHGVLPFTINQYSDMIEKLTK